MTESKHERAMAAALTMYGSDLEAHVRELAVVPGRRLRWDFAFPTARVLVELQGGIYTRRGKKSDHTGARLTKDFAKLNEATIAGWRTLMFGPRDLESRTLPATVETIRRALAASAHHRTETTA